MKKSLVIKIGTNVLTRKNGDLDYNLIHELVRQISELQNRYRIILVSSGAVGAGRQFCSSMIYKDPEVKNQILSSVGQPRLLQIYQSFFEERKQKIAQVLITKNDFKHKESFFNIKNTFQGLFDNDIIPIVNENDVVKNHQSTFGDNDQLAALTASMIDAEILIILSDVRGLFTADPKTSPEAKIIPHVEKIDKSLYSFCRNTLSKGGSGGMFSKLRAAEIATLHGIPVLLGYGKTPDILNKIPENRYMGTYFAPHKKKSLNSKGTWMKLIADVQGIITVDPGAKEAICKSDGSLLAVGIQSVEGDFQSKQIVMIQDSEKNKIGVGITKVDSATLTEKIQNRETSGLIVIHKNDLYTLQ